MNKNPLAGVAIQVNQHTFFSDSEGHFTLNSTVNKEKCSFSAIGYVSKSQFLESSQKEVTILLMEQKPEIRQQP